VTSLQKKILTVQGAHGSHRQTYWVASELPQAQRTLRFASGERAKPKNQVVDPRTRVTIHYGMLFSKKANAGVDHAMSAIGKVHSVPKDLYKLPIKVKGSLGGANGLYKLWQPFGGNEINVSKWARGPTAAAAHEYGHFLDHHLFGDGRPTIHGMASMHWAMGRPQGKEIAPLMRALYKSDAAKRLVAKHRENERAGDYHGQRCSQYLLMPPEMLARAYGQYIGLRASKQIHQETIEYGEGWRRHGYHAQWEDRDFEPIAREFDRLFQNRRLLRHRRAA